MNDKRKEYLKKWREDNKEHIKNYKKEYAKTHDSSFKKLQNKYKQLQQENKQLKDNWNNLREYFNERIEVRNNILSSPFCDFKQASKERLIYSQCLEKLEELEQVGDSNENEIF